MNFTNTARKKYATSLIAMYKLGLIDKKLTSNIHRNTLYYWDNKINIDNYIGFELDQVWDERKSDIELMMKHNAYFQIAKICLCFLIVINISFSPINTQKSCCENIKLISYWRLIMLANQFRKR